MKKISVVLVSFLFLLISCSGSNIDMVRDGAFEAYPDITVGEMVDAIFDEVEWEEIVAEDGKDYVNMHGTLEGDKASIQFRILDDESWIVYALEINGEPDTTDNIAEDLYNLYLIATEGY
ncbi:hypothetical protein OFR29_05795 [Brachyspira hyodysenteriae]|nr:hypothetical protein [Brachyspira hyodysenteriae]MCZ9891806.1 hypothetical protein [Brachyspira hyodysenteriae]MCZ9989359.1 hypothetical protein [Brachyspira hyodysenteriae]MCZ9997717.1 hypothetical protein [Brachyspira hyodysenteriae]MDA0001159.1 hypothetical protein [Brachyspira hyodysenteriae]MDA0006168.1 hypothetical protein [Brachyspira hyodysenteriae]